MSYRTRTDGPKQVFHLIARVNWRAWHLEDEEAKALLAALIREAAIEFGVTIYAYALMSNHFHLVVQSPPEPLYGRLTSRRLACRHRAPWPKGHQNASVISQFMRRIRGAITRARQSALGLSGRFWEGRYDARSIRGPLSFAVRIAYDHRNPVKARMVRAPEGYRWSSARAWTTNVQRDIPVELARAPFQADLAGLRSTVLQLQRSGALDDADAIPRIIRKPDRDGQELEQALRSAGLLFYIRGVHSAT